MNKTESSIFSRYLLLLLLLFQGVSGLFGGTALLLDPTGESLGLPLKWLQGTPFGDYRFPGLILLTVLGVFPSLVWVGLWNRKAWSWKGSLLVGIALVIWIGVEIIMVGYHTEPPLQVIYGMTGLLITLIAFQKVYWEKYKPF
jgi:hypothetical protein